jgi:hypothetical protein
VELHGSRHTYLLRNAPRDVEAVRYDPQATTAIRSLLGNAKTFVAIGYGGREKGIMDLLIEAAKVYQDKHLFWVDRSPDPKSISDRVREFLATSTNGRLFLGQDTDRFFLDLCQSLKIRAPRAILEPLGTVERLIKEISKSDVNDPDIQAVINEADARVKRLKKHDEIRDPEATKASEIREKRLAGDSATAYSLAIKEIK